MTRTLPRLRALAAVTTASALVLGACGGGSEPAFDPVGADSIAHNAMLIVEDLPGEGWAVTEVDQFDDDQELPADTEACRALDRARTAVRDAVQTSRAGRAKTEFSREHDSGFETTVEATVNVFNDEAAPKRAFAAAEKEYSAKNVTDCFRAALSEGLGPEFKLTATTATPQAAAPEGGIARAVAVTLEAGGEKLDLRFEVYLWRFSNAGITVSLNGTTEDLPKDVSVAAVGKVQAKLVEIAEE
ncbi:MAG: hypothetical protein ACKVVT_14965 [Dehalococcoidia bacterium]